MPSLGNDIQRKFTLVHRSTEIHGIIHTGKVMYASVSRKVYII